MEPKTIKRSPRFERVVSATIEWETGGDKHGGLTMDPNDAGGTTKWGISQKAYPTLDIKNLTYKEAVDIYYSKYWNPLYDVIPDEELAFRIFDLSVLFGVKTVVRQLQKSVSEYKTLAIDGNFGPMTLTAITMAIVEKKVNFNLLLQDRMKVYTYFITTFRNRSFRQGWYNRIARPYNGVKK